MKDGKIKLIILGLMILLITDSGYAKYEPVYGYYGSLIGLVLFGVYCTFKLFSRFKVNIMMAPRSFLVLAIISVWLFFFSLMMGAGIGPTLRYLCILVSAYYISSTYEFEKVAVLLTNMLFIFAVAALVMWFMVFLIPESYNLFPVLIFKANNSSGKLLEYRTIGLANMLLSNYTVLPRIYSLFWEPGVCQAYFNIAILLTLKFFKGKKKVLYLIVFGMGVVLTLSTTGFITCAVVLLFALLMRNDSDKRTNQLLKVGILVLVTVVLLNLEVLIGGDIYESIFGKLSGGGEHTSVASRINSITGNIDVIKKHFLFGTGLNQSSRALKEIGIVTDQTNTLFDCLATFGIIIGFLFIICWGYFIKKISTNIVENAIIILTFLLIFSGEDFIQSLFFYMLLMYGMTSLVDKKELCRNKHIRYINT